MNEAQPDSPYHVPVSAEPFTETPQPVDTTHELGSGVLSTQMELPGFPEKRLRMSYENPETLDERMEQYEMTLKDFTHKSGIPALRHFYAAEDQRIETPSDYQNGEPEINVRHYKVTDKIYGENLMNIRKDSLERPTDDQVKQLAEGVLNYYDWVLDAKARFLRDVNITQFTYGHTDNEPKDKIYFHDLDFTDRDFNYSDFSRLSNDGVSMRLSYTLIFLEHHFELDLTEANERLDSLAERVIAEGNVHTMNARLLRDRINNMRESYAKHFAQVDAA